LNRKLVCWFALLLSLVASSVSAQVKFHPGHYLMLNGGNTLEAHLKHIDEIGQIPSIKGVQVRIWWKQLETSKGVYDYSRIDAYLARLARYNKRLVIRVMDRKYTTSSPSEIMPSYMMTSAYNGGLVRTRYGYAARLWEPAVMDRMIALYRAVGARYNSHKLFEGITTEEATLALPTPFPAGYSHSALELQYERLMTRARPAMPNTALFMNANWIGNLTLASKLVQSLVEPYAAVNNSNTVPDLMSHGQRATTGGGSMGADYRGLLAIATSVEHAEMGGSSGDFTPAQIGSFAYSTLRANYVFWVRNTWSGDASQRWETGILPYLRSNPPVRTGCPPSYGVCNMN
jgi:hypothetical protein